MLVLDFIANVLLLELVEGKVHGLKIKGGRALAVFFNKIIGRGPIMMLLKFTTGTLFLVLLHIY